MDDNEIEIPKNATFKRTYTYEYYTYFRIVEILKENNLYLQEIVWYKAYRHSEKHRYNVREIGTDKLIRGNLYLDNLREILARLNYPLKKSTRNPNAAHFLQIVNQISRGEEKG